MELDESIMAGIVVVGYQFTLGGEVYEITRIVQEGDCRIVTAVPYVGEAITIRIGGSDND